jgi:5-methylcytosine-specific restriction enzyme A
VKSNEFRRIPVEAGYRTPSQLPRGPSGRALCRGCGSEVPAGRRSWCSDACVNAHKIKTDPGYQAKLVLARDHGICASCGLDCVALASELLVAHLDSRLSNIESTWCREVGWTQSGYVRCCHVACRSEEALQRCYRELPIQEPLRSRMITLGLRPCTSVLNRRLWEMDHIVPVVEGGGSCGIENLRTLCRACHRRETACLAKRRALARKRDRVPMAQWIARNRRIP